MYNNVYNDLFIYREFWKNHFFPILFKLYVYLFVLTKNYLFLKNI